MLDRLRELLKRLEAGRGKNVVQFIKFSLVGVSNTLISYAIEMVCYYVLLRNVQFTSVVSFLTRLGISAAPDSVRVVVVTALSFFISTANSYYWNSRYVFSTEGEKGSGRSFGAYLRTVLSYAVTGLVLSPAIKVYLNGQGVPYWASAMLSLLITVPLNFVLNKFWAFARKDGKKKA